METLAAVLDAQASLLPNLISPTALQLPQRPSEVDPRDFYLYWRRKFHRTRFQYNIIKVLRALSSLGFRTWRDAVQERDTHDELCKAYLPEMFTDTQDVDADAREDVASMGRRAQEEVDSSLDRPLRDEILFRLNEALKHHEDNKTEFEHFKRHHFFRQIGNAGHFAKLAMKLLDGIETDRAKVLLRRREFGKRSA